jgi:hypothetical protein
VVAVPACLSLSRDDVPLTAPLTGPTLAVLECRFNISDGIYDDRCLLVLPPTDWTEEEGPLPMIFLMVGSDARDEDCGSAHDSWGYTCEWVFALRVCLLCSCLCVCVCSVCVSMCPCARVCV